MTRTSEIGFKGTTRFEIKRQLGVGGMGMVYEAFDRDRRQTVALKTLKRFDARALIRYKNEFRALHDIDHRNLVSLYELFEEQGECFFTMELVTGVDFLAYVRGASTSAGDVATGVETLRARAAAGPSPSEDTMRAESLEPGAPPEPSPRYDEERLRASLTQLAQGVAALHAAGKVHRDIKPSNVLVKEDGHVILLDFGLVTGATKDGQSTHTNIVGTPEYMAPEQALSRDVGPAADWYSVGVVLYEALTARLPHSGETRLELLMKKQKFSAAPPRQRVPSVPKDLDGLCVELLQANPQDRPSAGEILEQLGLDPASPPVMRRASTNTGFSQTTPFVGREHELEELRGAFEQSRKESLVVVVEGESGLGKTELVKQFCERLASDVSDVVVLSGRCYERESVAYKAFDGIVDDLSRYLTRLPKQHAASFIPRRAALLPRLFPVLLRVEQIAGAPRTAEIPDPQEMRRQMFGALRELLARLTDHNPVVLTIDDLQWTDADSLILLQEILCDTAAPNLLLIATMRPMDPADRARVLESTRTLEQRCIEVRAFSEERTKELTRVLFPSLDEPAVAVIASEAAGHPLFVMELVRYAEGAGVRHGLTLDQTLWQRISALPANLLALLQIVCVADARLTQATAADAAEQTLAELQRSATGLRIAYLVRTGGVRSSDLIEPYHDRVREIVSEHLSDAARERCHRRLSLALARAGSAKTAPQALVRHAAAAGDPVRAAEYAEAAGHHAIEAMAFDRAAEFFQTALQLGRLDDDKTRALRIALAGALANAGRSPEAAEVFSVAAEGADSSTQLDCQRHAAEQWLISGHIERGLNALAELLTQIGVSMPATAGRALRSLLWARLKLRIGRLRWAEKTVGQINPDTLTRIDVYNAVSHGLSLVDNIRGADFQSRGLLLALGTGERFRVARALFTESVFLCTQGGKKLTRASTLIDTAVAISGADPYLRAWQSIANGARLYFQSRYRESAEQMGDAEQRLRAHAGTTWELNSARLFHLWALVRMGELGEALPLIDQHVRDATRRGDLYARTSLIRSCHLGWLARDDMEEAHRALEQTSWAPLAGGYHLQHWFSFRARGELALYEGQPTAQFSASQAEFQDLKKSLLLRVVTIRVDAHWLLGRQALTEALASDSPATLLNAARRLARRLERENDVYARASAWLVRAAIAAQSGDIAAAQANLATAATTAEQAKLPLHAVCARRRHGQLLGDDEGAALVAAADEWMHDQGIRNPGRMTEVIAPGFPSQGRAS